MEGAGALGLKIPGPSCIEHPGNESGPNLLSPRLAP